MIKRLFQKIRRRIANTGASTRSGLSEQDLALIIDAMYQSVLWRPADAEALRVYTRALRSGLSLREFRSILLQSGEARAEGPFDLVTNTTMMGTQQVLTKAAWKRRLAQIGPADPVAPTPGPAFVHTGEYVVSAIASMYKAGRYIEKFLDNITGQSIFPKSELIIIDADSSEGESDIIAKYQERFPNIVYRRINYRIGVYDAWNIGVGLARGRYLTNTNVDDLRRGDSFELQASALDEFTDCDVVYQNFFYTLDDSLDYDQVARMGFQSDVPLLDATNLVRCNYPHNAPMWRRSLHRELGLFDTAFKSAGDHEFWLRCLSGGKRFHRIVEPHVAYYLNPEGLSTNAHSRGVEEGRWVLRRYRHLADSAP